MGAGARAGPGLSDDIPGLAPYLVSAPGLRAAVIVCPGGGYIRRVDREVEPIARWLNELGPHVYPGGEHGWGHGWNGNDQCSWRESCAEWLRLRRISAP